MKKIFLIIGALSIVSLTVLAVESVKQKTSTSVIKKTNIEGQGFLKTRGGEVKTCAGEVVSLYDLDNYAKIIELRRITRSIKVLDDILDNLDRYRFSNDMSIMTSHYLSMSYLRERKKILKINFPDIEFRTENIEVFRENAYREKNIATKKLAELRETPRAMFQTQCDATGNFILKNVPYGSFGITTTVIWTSGESQQGGEVLKKITVDENLQKIFITE